MIEHLFQKQVFLNDFFKNKSTHKLFDLVESKHEENQYFFVNLLSCDSSFSFFLEHQNFKKINFKYNNRNFTIFYLIFNNVTFFVDINNSFISFKILSEDHDIDFLKKTSKKFYNTFFVNYYFYLKEIQKPSDKNTNKLHLIENSNYFSRYIHKLKIEKF